MRPKKVVLYVDGDDQRLSCRAFLLETWGYRVLQVDTATAALALLGTVLPWSVDLMMVMESLPDAEGDWLARRVKTLRPEVRTMMIGERQGYCDSAHVDVFLPRGANSAAEIRERTRILVMRKRGPKINPDTKMAQEARENAARGVAARQEMAPDHSLLSRLRS
jgi:two-component system response regulator CpxR